MQIVITLNSEEELKRFFESMKGEMTGEQAEAQVPVGTVVTTPAVVETAVAPAPAPVQTQAPAPAAKPDIPKLKLEVQTKAIALMDAGKQLQLQALLKKYSVPALPMLTDDQLAPFMADLEVL